MSKPIKRQSPARSDEHEDLVLFRKMSRLLEVLVRLNVQNMRGERSQNEMISLLDSVGCGQSEIADFLGTSTNTVNVSLYKARRKAGKK